MIERKRTSSRRAERLYLTVPELAERWTISLAHAYRVVERGMLPSLRVGHAIRIPVAAVERYERDNDAA
jgi:excisionase family DNA binding protein